MITKLSNTALAPAARQRASRRADQTLRSCQVGRTRATDEWHNSHTIRGTKDDAKTFQGSFELRLLTPAHEKLPPLGPRNMLNIKRQYESAFQRAANERANRCIFSEVELHAIFESAMSLELALTGTLSISGPGGVGLIFPSDAVRRSTKPMSANA
jgi:hypothetical protein